VSFALLLAACANPPTAQQPSATAASSSHESRAAPVALATTAQPTLPPTPTALPTSLPATPTTLPTSLPPTDAPTLAATAVPTEAPDTSTPLPPTAQPADRAAAAVVRVIDGDTVDVRLDGQVVRMRLIGIDTPEVVDPRQSVQCFGREASNKAHELLDGQTVALEADPSQDDKDRYGRLLRYVWLSDGRLFNQEMVAQGYAFEYTYDLPYKYQAEF
jgi:micrococcal nuclease